MVSAQRPRRLVRRVRRFRTAAAVVALVAVAAVAAWAVDGCEWKHDPELFDPDGVVVSWTTGPLDDYEVAGFTVNFDGLPGVATRSAGSRRVLVGYWGVSCPEAPIVVVRRVSQSEINVYIVPRMAERLAGCDDDRGRHGVELVLVQPLAVRAVQEVEKGDVGELRELPPESLPGKPRGSP